MTKTLIFSIKFGNPEGYEINVTCPEHLIEMGIKDLPLVDSETMALIAQTIQWYKMSAEKHAWPIKVYFNGKFIDLYKNSVDRGNVIPIKTQ